MKKILNLGIVLALFAACSRNGPKDELKEPQVVLHEGTETEQTVYADETSLSPGIFFTATAEWRAVVQAVSGCGADTAANRQVDWLQLSQYEGKAGSCTLALTLSINHTGKDRQAEIAIICGTAAVVVKVEQKGTDKDGNLPDVPVISKDRLITRIVKKEENGDEVIHDFFYDDAGRVVKISRSELWGNGRFTDTYTMLFSYADAQVSYERTHLTDGMESPDKYSSLVTLDEEGRAVSGEYIDDEWKDSYTLAYNAAGCLIRCVRKHVDPDFESVTEENLVWNDAGNLVEAGWETGTLRHLTDKADYGVVLNKANLDLNWFLVLDSEGFNLATGEPSKFFAMMGYCGKRTKNMAKQVIEGTYPSSTITFNYQLDGDGFISEIHEADELSKIIFTVIYNK